MTALRYFTSGESHGKALVGIIEGIPAGLELTIEDINRYLRQRQQGYGRGGRMKIETDTAEFLAGVRLGKTLGSPIALIIENSDWENWTNRMSYEAHNREITKVEIPRPGHADFAGAFKYRHDDIRNVLERASARETTCRVALGSIARKMLAALGIEIGSHVVRIKNIDCGMPTEGMSGSRLNSLVDDSPLRCLNREKEPEIITLIDAAKEKGDSFGGVGEVIVSGVPVGLGSHVQWDRKLDGRIAQALMSIQAVKGVEIGLGFGFTENYGSALHDEIFLADSGDTAGGARFTRKTNNAGGIEGGMTNGEPIIARFALKPLSTLPTPLASVNIFKNVPEKAHRERTDTFVMPAACVIAEAVMALVIADAVLEKFGGDSIAEISERMKNNPYLYPVKST